MYAFIHIPKTAGTTLRYLFRRSFGAQHCDVKCPKHCRETTPWLMSQNLKSMQTVYPSLSGVSGHRVCCFTDLKIAFPEIRYFTFLRDPVKRFISAFHYTYRGQPEQWTIDNLEKYALNPVARNLQTKWVCGQEDSSKAIETLTTEIGLVGLTENFDESLLLLRRWLNNSKFNINYQVRRVAKGKPHLPYYTDPYLIDLIKNANQHDIILYEYAVNELFPKQVSEYGEKFNFDLSCLLKEQETFQDFSEPLWGKIKRDLIYKPSLNLPSF